MADAQLTPRKTLHENIFKSLIHTQLMFPVLAMSQSGSAVDTSSAEEIVQKQFDAYNARDMDAFLATYADEVELFSFPNTRTAKGKEEMRKRYTVRFSDTILHGIVVKRIVMGNAVIDHERVRVTLPEGPGVMEAIAIYEVHDGKISKVTFISGKKTPGEKL